MTLLLHILLIAIAQAVTVNDSPAATPTPPLENVAPPLESIAIVGASASAGWGVVIPQAESERKPRIRQRHVRFAEVLSAVLTDEAPRLSDHSDVMFFTSPLQIGASQIDRAIQKEPSALVGIDFLFWYAYGSKDAKGEAISIPDGPQRLALLEHGLNELNRLSCHVLVGDIPDVSSALDVRPISMLVKSQVPSAETLVALNARIKEWAGSKPNITVLPLATATQAMQEGRALSWNGHQWPASSKLLQFDKLHPTILGLIAMAEMTSESLARCCGLTGSESDPAVVERTLSEQTLEVTTP